MFKRWLTLGSAAGLLLAAGALGGCDQNQTSNRDVRQDNHAAHVNTAKVEKGAERASREISAGATALYKGVEKGVKEGTAEANRGAPPQSQNQGNTTTSTTTTERSSGQ
jgi:hypothetical protein